MALARYAACLQPLPPCLTPCIVSNVAEYCWGNESTTWGAVRIFNDSHPEPFQIRTFELGESTATTGDNSFCKAATGGWRILMMDRRAAPAVFLVER